jgi:hypothetical protein
VIQNDEEIENVMEDEQTEYDDDVTEIKLEAEKEYPSKKLPENFT